VSDTPVPLARLFAMAFRDLVDDLHARLAERGWDDHRPAFGFVLVAARDGPTDATALAGLLGVTKQAASKLVDTMAAAGLVERSAGAPDARRRPVVITARGRRLLAAAEEVYEELEEEWAGVVGRRDVETTRSTLTSVLRARHGGGLPPIRPTW
jgi:DNA-binding MarR family transcriptional regulator